MSDLIERAAAIDALAIGEEFLKRVLDDVGVVGNEREKYEWGLGLIESYIADMKDLPPAQPAQPEIIRCRDCKHWDKTWTNNWPPDYHYCPMIDVVNRGDFYCRHAERRTDE